MGGLLAAAAARDLEDLTRQLNAIHETCAPLMDDLTGSALDALRTERDCSCTTHEGPHWLHADQLWREKNVELLMRSARETDAATAVGIFRSYVAEELARMQSYRTELERIASCARGQEGA